MRLEGEKETLGNYLTGHPADAYLQEFKDFVHPLAHIDHSNKKRALICGLIRTIKRVLTKRGKKLMIIGLEDAKSSIDIIAFSEVFESQNEILRTGEMLLVEGELGEDDYTGGMKMTANTLYSIDDARTQFARCVALTLSSEDKTLLSTLQTVLKAHPGECVVQIRYTNADAKAKAAINLASEWRVKPSDKLLTLLSDILDKSRIEVCY